MFHTKIAVQPHKAKLIVQASAVLHNFLQKETTGMLPTGPEEEPASSEATTVESFRDFQNVGYRGTDEAAEYRRKFTSYFVEHPLPWQVKYINRGSKDNE